MHVMNMAQGLSRAGADVLLLAHRGDEALLSSKDKLSIFDFYGVEPCFSIEWLPGLPIPGRTILSAAVVLLKLARSRPHTVIGRHTKACAMACLLGIPTVYETHQPIGLHSRLDRLLVSMMLKSPSFRGFVVISKRLQEILIEEMGAAKSRILVAHDAAQIPADYPPIVLGPRDRMQVGYVGSLYAGRGVELVLDVAEVLSGMDFHIIGGSAEELVRWKRVGAQTQNVHFHGFQTPAKAAAMRSGFDVLLAPYQRQTFVPGGHDTSGWMSPLKIFEYMSSAKPILCSDIPVLREVMVHDHNALLLPPEDRSAWVAALRRIQTVPEYARALGERAFNDFTSEYTWDQRANRILTFASDGELPAQVL